MHIIEIAALSNGAHRNQQGELRQAPEGWAVIPAEMPIPKTFPFVGVEATEVEGVMTVTALTPGEVPEPEEPPETEG